MSLIAEQRCGVHKSGWQDWIAVEMEQICSKPVTTRVITSQASFHASLRTERPSNLGMIKYSCHLRVGKVKADGNASRRVMKTCLQTRPPLLFTLSGGL